MCRGIKQSLLREFQFQCFEGGLQGAQASRFDMFDDQLEITAALIQTDLGADDNLVPFFRGELQPLVKASKHGASDLRLVILEREIPVARSLAGKNPIVLTCYPDLRIARLEQAFYLSIQFRDANRLLGGCRGRKTGGRSWLTGEGSDLSLDWFAGIALWNRPDKVTKFVAGDKQESGS